MGLMGFLTGQMIRNVEWNEHGDGVLVFKYPMHDNEIESGAQLTVRESQAGMFVNEGQIADLFAAGRHELMTKNLPVLTALKNWDRGFSSPFKSDIYFFSLREQLNQRWGSPQPISIRDRELGPIRIRAFGSFSFRINDPKLIFKKLSGTRDLYTTEDIDDQLRALILTNIASYFGKAEVSFFDMAANQTKFSETMQATLTQPFAEYGIQLCKFFVQSISLPDEVQEQIDKLASMRMTGDLQKYAQFQGASAIPIAAANPGGTAGAGLGLGLGMGMAKDMQAAVSGSGGTQDDPLARINQLHDLMVKNIITAAEFESKKAELLKRVT